jgi:hypothetical protein
MPPRGDALRTHADQFRHRKALPRPGYAGGCCRGYRSGVSGSEAGFPSPLGLLGPAVLVAPSFARVVPSGRPSELSGATRSGYLGSRLDSDLVGKRRAADPCRAGGPMLLRSSRTPCPIIPLLSRLLSRLVASKGRDLRGRLPSTRGSPSSRPPSGRGASISVREPKTNPTNLTEQPSSHSSGNGCGFLTVRSATMGVTPM